MAGDSSDGVVVVWHLCGRPALSSWFLAWAWPLRISGEPVESGSFGLFFSLSAKLFHFNAFEIIKLNAFIPFFKKIISSCLVIT